MSRFDLAKNSARRESARVQIRFDLAKNSARRESGARVQQRVCGWWNTNN